ncbi:MAG: hypothetical protein IKG86_02680 [Paludibacteraceae bacterium]|nr:hypothetical protein [Paludibacteraceae bacterium]
MKKVKGQFISINGERFYEIANYDRMQPFFISLASDTDLWMYLASTGGLTCGRRSPEESLFPYYTDDKITESYFFTGPYTRINDWIPFSKEQQPVYKISRKIAKSTVGNQIVFCEENHTLGLRFSYLWAPAGKHGWVRRATLENLGKEAVRIRLTDMLRNVLPAGVERKTQNEFSTLVDGYKKTELVPGTSLALFRMEAILVDRAEPSESLTCNTVYALGLPENTDYTQTESKGVRGAFVAKTGFQLSANSHQTWYNVLDVSQDAVAVHALMHFIQQPNAIARIEEAMVQSTETLRRIVAQNDGIQHTGDEANDARHFANVLFNTMRGGYYLRYPPKSETEDLPLTFGRRHGDPSRPWNLFSIRVQDEQGKPVVAYQGNWRDIFQNWEALSYSYPLYINHIIAKFLNATTADGYNPYRISNEGLDYEVIEPENPWSNIGYWGDHQIIYLLRLLEISYKHDPATLHELLNSQQYAFANVPYRLKSYDEIVADPKNSIRFDDEEHRRIQALTPKMGADAKLLMDENGQVRRTTMADKLLITLLTKLSNFIPYAGIWMNTLRPEWNDANNALVGYGASMVTLCYMRRYVAFLQTLLQTDITVGIETERFLHGIHESLRLYETSRQYIDAAGRIGETYRERVYKGISGLQTKLGMAEVQAFLSDALVRIDESIHANIRKDGLYEAYNLIRFTETDRDLDIEHLYPMLEGQVAVLTSGLLSAEESVQLLDAMRRSELYREDQRSYMLYPNRRRKTFLEMNNLPEEAKHLPEVKQYLGTVLKQDCDGGIHFDARYRNANDLPEVLKDLYEQIFHHHAFTGRSGTFYKYEGLGCIYWHMVSKLLLAVGETIDKAQRDQVPRTKDETLQRLQVHYMVIREGIGAHKRPDEYGAFPFDPYSHTPSMAGVQQPGMTGQVKEDIISRWFELGVSVRDGQITFRPTMLRDEDFTDGELRFTYCGTEIIYRKKTASLKVESRKQGLTLSKEDSGHLFARDGKIKQLTIEV